MADNRPEIILTFHGIGTPPAGVPESERPYWIPEAEFSATIERVAGDATRHGIPLTVTFDDGNRSDLLTGAPVLREHGLKGIFFPCAGRLGQAGYLDADDLAALIADGFAIGSHGMDHRPWASLEGAALDREVSGSKEMLEQALGRPVPTAALPFGSYNRRVLQAARKAGYTRIYSSDPGPARPGAWFQRRFSYRTGLTFDLEAMLAEHARLSRRLTGTLKQAVKSLR